MAEVDRLFLTEEARELYSRFSLSLVKIMVIIGSLFGDASMFVRKDHSTPSFNEGHCMEQLEYLKWKAAILGKPDGVKFHVMSQGYSKGKTIVYFRVGNKAFTDIDKLFYIRTESGRRRKIVTMEALELLIGSPLALAVFLMDDGEYNIYSNQIIFNTCGYTLEENDTMAKQFEQLLGAPVRVKIKRKRYPRVALSSKATDKFIKIVTPFIHPTLYYKVDQNIMHYFDEHIIKKLMEEYGKKPARRISEEIGLTIQEVYVIAYRLGLTKHKGYIRYRNKPFTEQEKEYLINTYGKVPGPEIAKRLNTSTKYIHQLALKLGLTKRTHKHNNEGEAGEYICAHTILIMYNR